MTPTAENVGPTVEERPHGFSPKTLLSGASALILATGTERAFSFGANLLAARLGGAATFGGYSLAMTTANNIAAYAGAGIGSTATRFSGEYPEGSPRYRTVTKALALVSIVSAVLASVVLLAGAGPLASVVLKQPRLASLLEWASLSAGIMILFECCRGFLIGQRKLKALLMLSGVMGAGMIVFLPLASHAGPTAMVCTQVVVGAAAITAVLMTFLRGTRGVEASGGKHVVEMARRVWSFGFVQLLGIVGLNAAGWWITSVVSRADSSLVEMGIFAVANQVRNVVALVPSLLTQSSFALMANEEAAPSRVLLFCTFLATLVVLVLGGFGIVVCPLLLPLVWGHAYSGGVLASSLAFATAIVHMSGSAAAARLTILSLPITGLINAVWSVMVVVLSLVFFGGFRAGNAAMIATAIYFAAHLISALLVLIGLLRLRSVPAGLIPLFFVANGAALALAILTVMPSFWGINRAMTSVSEVLVVAVSALAILRLGKRHGFSASSLAKPANDMIRRLLRKARP